MSKCHGNTLELVNYAGAARLLGISPRTLERWAQQGEIPFYRVGRNIRFRPSELAEWIDSRRVPEVGR